jgi:AAA+ superfamily predicted ATPase
MSLAQDVADLWAAGTPLVYVVTGEEDRAAEECRAAAASFDATFAIWSSHRGLEPLAPEAKDPLAALRALAQGPAPLLAVLLDFHGALADPLVARAVRDLAPRLAAEGRCIAVIAPRLALPEGLAQEAAVVRLALPGARELGALLDALAAALGGAGAPPLEADARHRAITAARGLAAGQARRAFARALRADPALGAAGRAIVLEEKQRVLARDLGLELVDAVRSVDDVGGLDAFKAFMAERSLAFGPDAADFGLPPPRGVLLVGVQGCGKSLAAKAAAARLGVPLLRLDLSRVLGAAERAEENLARALDAAEAIAPVALWVDEIEKAFAGSAPGQGGDARAARLLGAFSTWLQERHGPVFVVATANDVTRLPPELLRRGRFDELFFVDLPDLEARREILTLHLRRRDRDPARFDLDAVAQSCADYSGAELEQIVVGALHRAFAHGREVETGDLRRVAQELVPLFKTYEEQIKALREWARGRARPAGREGAIVDLFRRVEA